MKLKKSIPMFISILLVFTLGIILTTIHLFSVININTTNKYISNAIIDSIILNSLLIIFYIYMIHKYIYSFNKYLINQKTKAKTKQLLSKLADAVEDKIKHLVNDKSSRQDIREETPYPFNSSDFNIDNEMFVKKHDSDLFNTLNKDLDTINNYHVISLNVLKYIVRTMRLYVKDLIDITELPIGLRQAVNIINIRGNTKPARKAYKLVEILISINDGEFINEQGHIKYVNVDNGISDSTVNDIIDKNNVRLNPFGGIPRKC